MTEPSEQFKNLFETLLALDVQRELPPNARTFWELSDNQIAYLLSTAGRLALSDDPAHQQTAYDIATRVFKLVGAKTASVARCCEFLLSRLGNFPGRSLLIERSPQLGKNSSGSLPARLHFESVARRLENTITVGQERQVTLTDFQADLYRALSSERALSFSAPTSAGKSFVLSIDVVRRFQVRRQTTQVIVVPTRALIRQVMRSIRHELRQAGITGVRVQCIPHVPTKEEANAGLVYVLTQERLNTLLYAPEGSPSISALMIDEAHEIGSRGRGLTLHAAIQTTRRQHPRATVAFSSPLTENPEFLLNLYSLPSQPRNRILEEVSPVSQNLFAVSAVRDEPKSAEISLVRGATSIALTRIRLSAELRGGNRVAVAARELTLPHSNSLVYANTAIAAERFAREIASQLPETRVPDPQVRDLQDFLRLHIHPKYSLIPLLSRGVAFHYGRMPEVVRSRVEELFTSRKLRFVCCTSTLLQGVNLPAQNIFIDNPKSGIGHPMSPASFWNLAGRAGRLTQEFQGNVWCICRNEWESDPLAGNRLSRVTSALRDTLVQDRDAVVEAITDRGLPSESDEGKDAEQAFGHLFAHYTLEREDIAESTIATPALKPYFQYLDRLCGQVRESATLPKHVFARNAGISPWRLEELRSRFQNTPNPRDIIPMGPYIKGGYARMRDIFYTLEVVFFKTGTRRYRYFNWLAFQWIRGTTMGEIVANRIRWRNIPENAYEVSSLVRELLDDIESELRYKYVKYLRAYYDVLQTHLRAIGREELLLSAAPLHVMIENGAADQITANLMGLGISRTTAILLRWAVRFPTNATLDQCRARLNTLRPQLLRLPELCRDEIIEFQSP